MQYNIILLVPGAVSPSFHLCFFQIFSPSKITLFYLINFFWVDCDIACKIFFRLFAWHGLLQEFHLSVSVYAGQTLMQGSSHTQSLLGLSVVDLAA